jgi:hypothetical protein
MNVFAFAVHCAIPTGGLSTDHMAWVHPRYHFFLPVEVAL